MKNKFGLFFNKKHLHVIAYILIAGFGVLLWLIARQRPIFVDETSFQINILHFLNHKTIVPVYINYPTMFSYLIGIPTIVFFKIIYAIYPHAHTQLADPYYQTFFYEYHIYHWILLGRAVVILLACTSLLYFYRFLRKQYGLTIAVISVLFFALDPFGFYMDYAAYALPDTAVASILFFALAVLCSSLKFRSVLLLYLCSFLIGFSGSAKLNGLLPVIFLFSVIITYRKHFNANTLKTIILSAIFCYVGFVFGSPIFFVNPYHYSSGFGYESSLLTAQMRIFDTGRSPLWAFQSFFTLSPAFSIFIIFCFIYGMIRPKKWRSILMFSIVFIFLVLAMLGKRSTVYFIVIYPLIFFLGADILKSMREHIRRRLWNVFIAVLISILAVSFLKRSFLNLTRKDNRVLAKEWIYHNIPEKSIILLDWGYFPEIFIQPMSIEYNWWNQLAHSPELVSSLRKILKNEPSYIIRFLPNLNYDIPHDTQAEYLITSASCFQQYLTEKPRFSDLAVDDDDFNIEDRYHSLRTFYLNLLNDKTNFRQIQYFGDGNGPDIFIFQNSSPKKTVLNINK